jgi:hypothetical protein
MGHMPRCGSSRGMAQKETGYRAPASKQTQAGSLPSGHTVTCHTLSPVYEPRACVCVMLDYVITVCEPGATLRLVRWPFEQAQSGSSIDVSLDGGGFELIDVFYVKPNVQGP